jgi:peptidoglycan-associated lipoprotein
MRLNILTLAAAALILAACGSSSDESADVLGGGAQTAPITAQTTMPADPGLDPTSQEYLVVNIGDRVFFDFDRSDIKAEAQVLLDQVAVWMQTYPAVTLAIEGHCDERGTREYNLALGERRASAVNDYLVALGIEPGRLSTISFGKERPAVLGSNESSWAQNRRGVLVVN